MRVVIVGNGLAGTMAAKTLRELDTNVAIEVFAEEKYPYYPRPNLIEFLAGNIPFERVFAFGEHWHVRQNITVHLGNPVKKIRPGERRVEAGDGPAAEYDFLLLASGSSSFVPSIKGADKRGVFTLKTLDEAQALLSYCSVHREIVVIGGGLLGLEIARAMKTRGAEVEVVEFFDRLLPRQLDAVGAAILKEEIEKTGIRVRLGAVTEEILGDGEVRGVKFKGGDSLAASMAIIAAGVKPRLDLARDAGLAVDKAVLVDDHLQTSDPHIFAAGDSTQHRGRLYGIIPASFDQARIAASNVLGLERIYQGTIPSNTLKVVGLYLTSIGLVNPDGDGFEVVTSERAQEGIYKKIVLKNGTIAGVIVLGTKKGVSELSRLAAMGTVVERWKGSLLEDNFDFSLI